MDQLAERMGLHSERDAPDAGESGNAALAGVGPNANNAGGDVRPIPPSDFNQKGGNQKRPLQ